MVDPHLIFMRIRWKKGVPDILATGSGIASSPLSGEMVLLGSLGSLSRSSSSSSSKTRFATMLRMGRGSRLCTVSRRPQPSRCEIRGGRTAARAEARPRGLFEPNSQATTRVNAFPVSPEPNVRPMPPLEGLLRLRARADGLQTCHQGHQIPPPLAHLVVPTLLF